MENPKLNESPQQAVSKERMEALVRMSAERPERLAAAIGKDPRSKSLFERIAGGAYDGVKGGAVSAWNGTKAVFVGTGEFIGVTAAKMVHEDSASVLNYAVEKTEGIRSAVNVVGDALAITAFEAIHGEGSLLGSAADYWKEKGIQFKGLPAEKQAELVTSFLTQVAIGIAGSKGLGAASKTGAAMTTIDAASSAAASGARISAIAADTASAMRSGGNAVGATIVETAGNAANTTLTAAGKGAEVAVRKAARVGVAAAGLDKNALSGNSKNGAVRTAELAANDERFAAPRVRKVAGGGFVEEFESVPARQAAISAKPIDLAAERVARAAKAAENSSEFAQSKLADTSPVFVKRANGEISVGRVARILDDGKVDVAFSGKNGALLHQTMDASEFRKLNDASSGVSREIGAKQLRMKERMAAMAAREGKTVESSSSEIFKNASLNPSDRLARAAEELGLSRELNPKEAAALLMAHALKAEGESAFNFGNKSLGKKMRILEEGGFSNEQARVLLRKGFAGEAPVNMEKIAEIKAVLKRADYAEQSNFLSKASPDEISHALNHGFVDYAADAFEPDFLRSVTKMSDLRSANLANLDGVSASIRGLAKEAGKTLPADQKRLLSDVAERLCASSSPSFKEALLSASKSSEISQMVRAIPDSVSANDAMASVRQSLLKFSKNEAAQADLVSAVDAFAKKYPSRAKEAAMMLVETVDPAHWKNAQVLKADLGFSVNGDEFRPLLKEIAKNDPAKLQKIAESGTGNFQLKGLEKAAAMEKPFNARAFQDSFTHLPDREKLDIFLAEHPDTKLLSAKEISARVGNENLDRFFHAGGLERLQKEALGDPNLKDKIKRLLTHYRRTETGFSTEFEAALASAE